MKVRVSFIVEVDDHTRRAINHWYGRKGPANRQQVKDWYEANGRSMDDDLSQEGMTGEDEQEGVSSEDQT